AAPPARPDYVADVAGPRPVALRRLGRPGRGRVRGHLAPQLLEAIEVARLGREDVRDHVEVVHQDPFGSPGALDAARQQLVLALQAFEDAVVDRFRLAARVARAD